VAMLMSSGREPVHQRLPTLLSSPNFMLMRSEHVYKPLAVYSFYDMSVICMLQ
jgi:hypothetical protein